MSGEHWDAVYGDRRSEELGWYEPSPSTLDLVLRFSSPTDPVIDVGGGDSLLTGRLLDAGYEDLTVLDLSENALARARRRLRPGDRRVDWIHANVTAWEPPRTWTLWHDRAVFHFLTTESDQAAYASAALQALEVDGRLIVAAFSLDGPAECAGLPVERYDVETLADRFAPQFRLVDHCEVRPRPEADGDRRPYVAVVLGRA